MPPWRQRPPPTTHPPPDVCQYPLMHTKGNDSAQVLFVSYPLYLIYLPLAAGEINSLFPTQSAQRLHAPKKPAWLFFLCFSFILPFRFLSWLSRRDQGSVNERFFVCLFHLATPVDIFWAIHWVSSCCGMFCSQRLCFWEHFCVFSDFKRSGNTCGRRRKSVARLVFIAESYLQSVVCRVIGVYSTRTSGKLNVENNTTNTPVQVVVSYVYLTGEIFFDNWRNICQKRKKEKNITSWLLADFESAPLLCVLVHPTMLCVLFYRLYWQDNFTGTFPSHIGCLGNPDSFI